MKIEDVLRQSAIRTNARWWAPLSVIKFDERFREINVRLYRNAWTEQIRVNEGWRKYQWRFTVANDIAPSSPIWFPLRLRSNSFQFCVNIFPSALLSRSAALSEISQKRRERWLILWTCSDEGSKWIEKNLLWIFFFNQSMKMFSSRRISIE